MSGFKSASQQNWEEAIVYANTNHRMKPKRVKSAKPKVMNIDLN